CGAGKFACWVTTRADREGCLSAIREKLCKVSEALASLKLITVGSGKKPGENNGRCWTVSKFPEKISLPMIFFALSLWSPFHPVPGRQTPFL
ncbi:MAG: hypothetical protein LBL51_01380, partial [Synergistaceae bacterium]|nr:hypothetical protein [Synergistaceae bacterium]